MAASGTLYSFPDNIRGLKILIAAQYGGASLNVVSDFKVNAEFTKKFPLGSVPVFETKDGKVLYQSNAIAYYVSSPELRGTTDLDRAHVIQWLSYADNEILPAASRWTFPFLGILEYNKDEISSAKYQIRKVLTFLDTYLKDRTYLVGERVSLADVVVACTLLNVYKLVLDPNTREKYTHANRWFLTIVNQTNAKKVLGPVTLCEQEPKPPQSQAKPKGDQKEGKKDKKKEKKEKEQGDASSKAAEPAEELDPAELEKEQNSKDPLDGLPKGTFKMDDWKRVYSNSEIDVSLDYFWKEFDKENYSIWLGEYKYSDELQRVFMSCNLITGMFQRLDKMRKNAFGSVCLFGKDNDNSISGVWVWRGQGLAFEMSLDWQVDYETYSWKKLDPTNAEHKTLINNYLSWEGKDKDGRPFNQGKIFK